MVLRPVRRRNIPKAGKVTSNIIHTTRHQRDWSLDKELEKQHRSITMTTEETGIKKYNPKTSSPELSPQYLYRQDPM